MGQFRLSISCLDDTPLRAFELAGADGKWVAAQATIEGDAVIVKAEGIAQPKQVRYAMAPWPTANLGAKDHLAAAPFTLLVGAK